MTDSTIRVECVGSVARVTMNRPDVRNAFNLALIVELRDTFVRLGDDPDVRSIVLAGAGKAFSGGADVAWMRAALELSERENAIDAETMAGMFAAIDVCPKAVIARVHGVALGGGAGLAAVADIVVAAEDALFGFTEVKLGIVPAVISPFVLAKIGASHARALFLTGERFDAGRARRIGLVHDVVPAAELDRRIEQILGELRTAAPTAIAVAKHIVRAVLHADTAERATTLTTHAIAQQRTSPEGQEGLRAFLEHRPASWHDTSI